MISRVRGELLGGDADAGRVEVATRGGAVYEVHVPLTVFQRLPPAGSELEILTEYVVRDDVPSLYGFLRESERDLFRRLMKVKMVGPRLAMAMLGSYEAGRLARAIAEKDAKALVQVPGLGKKTAARVVLELADEVRDLAAAGGSDEPAARLAGEAVSALVGLGYGFVEADAAVRGALGSGDFGSAEEVVRQVLAQRGRDR